MAGKNVQKIVVVDDNPNNCLFLKGVLSPEGYEVTVLSSGRDALIHIESHEVDLVILDVMMPELDGNQVLEYLRQFYTPLQLPVIMATAKNETEDIVKSLQLGANDYLTKPINVDIALARTSTQLALREADRKLRKNQERFDLAVSGTMDGIWDWDLKENECYFSPRWKNILGYLEAELSDDPNEWFSRIHEKDRNKVEKEIQTYLKTATGHFESEYRMLHKDGSTVWVVTRGTALCDENGQAYRLAGAQTNITKTKAYDLLTGLYSKHLFCERLAQAMPNANEALETESAVFVIGFDQFNMIKDSLQHLQVDSLLVSVGHMLRQLVYPEDSVARFSGDEFAIFCQGLNERKVVENIARRIRDAFKQSFRAGGIELFISVGIGIVFLEPKRSPDEVLRNGIAAMNEARRAGKSQYCIFGDDIHKKTMGLFKMEAALRNALANDEFFLEYQAISDPSRSTIVGAEALIRWNHPERGRISPADFLPVAEERGLMVDIGEWVLERACCQAAVWYQKQQPLKVSVNFASVQLQQEGILEKVRSVLSQAGLPPHLLEIEITENALVDDMDKAVSFLKRVRELGVHTVLDDFGTGFSSLSYLRWLPIDVLKIDQSFVRELTTNATNRALTSSIIHMAKALHMQTISEGVETAEQLESLRSMGTDLVQGFFIARPQSPEDFIAFCRCGNSSIVQGSPTDNSETGSGSTYSIVQGSSTDNSETGSGSGSTYSIVQGSSTDNSESGSGSGSTYSLVQGSSTDNSETGSDKF